LRDRLLELSQDELDEMLGRSRHLGHARGCSCGSAEGTSSCRCPESGEHEETVEGKSEMSEVTYYVALPFVAADDGVVAGEAVECFNPNAAVMRAEALSRKPGHVGAVAFSRTGDPATGDFGDATVIRKFGDVPDDLSAL